MSRYLSVVIPTFNPNPVRLLRTLVGLQKQTLPTNDWELIIVDNASRLLDAFRGLDLSWHPKARIVREELAGLTHARIRGYDESSGDIVCYVDDDNVLSPGYLESVVSILGSDARLGTIGGSVVPEFAKTPSPWIREFDSLLALRDFGTKILICDPQINPVETYPHYLPLGAGMAVRREVLDSYKNRIESASSPFLDRTGASLSSGGDCDINLTALKSGYSSGYFGSLTLMHLIPESRCEPKYLAKLAYGSSRSWPPILHSHGMCPWKPISRYSSPVRKARAWVRERAWLAPRNYIRWSSVCGIFDGLSDIK